MSKVAKYRRQVSEDPDIDNLLSTLSPEEMEELEKELEVVDGEGSGPGEKTREEKSSPGPQNCEPELNHHGKEPRRVLRREKSVDETTLGENKGDQNEEEKGKETPPKDLTRKRDPKAGNESKKEESAPKTDPKGKAEAEPNSKESKAMNDKVKAMEKKLLGKDKKEEEKGSVLRKEKKEEEKGSVLRKDKKEEEKGSVLRKDKKEEEKSSAVKKEAGKDRKEEEKGSGLKKKEAGKEKKEEEKGSAAKETEKDRKEGEKVSALKKDTEKDKKEEEKSSESKKQAGKGTGGEGKGGKDTKEEERGSAGKEAKAEEEEGQGEAGKGQEGRAGPPRPGPTAEQPKDDEASSIFDELIERVRNNDGDVTDVNVNNSDCISNETLVRFAEALEFNTTVRAFALANTRADDHVAFAIAIMLKANKVLTSINLDSNHITGKGILAIFRALLQNSTLTELRFHNQRHICGGKTEMEIAKLLKENTTLLKLGYHFELAGPRMAVTNLLSRNMDRQRQRRLQQQKLAQEGGDKKEQLEVPKAGAMPKGSPKVSPQPSPKGSPKGSPKKGGDPAVPPPPPPPLAPPLLGMEGLRNSLSPATQRRGGDRALPAQEKNSRDQLLAAIRSSNLKQLKKVELPKLLQ